MGLDWGDADGWIRGRVRVVGAVEVVHVEPWATVARVQTEGGTVWFKACAAGQGFEVRLTAELFRRWPDRVAEVLDYDVERRWLLLADAGTALRELGNPPEVWLNVLPGYAELQRGEVQHAAEHVAHGVPDLRVSNLARRYEELARYELPIDAEDVTRVREFAPRFQELCAELQSHNIPDTIQHDDLHLTNVYVRDNAVRVLDWGDSCVSHPFASLFETFRFLEQLIPPHDPWFARLRDAYLEPWGQGLRETFALAMRVGAFAHAIAWTRQRDALPTERWPEFDQAFSAILRRAISGMR